MIGFTLLSDPIPLPRIRYDTLGMAYVDGERDPEPFRHPEPKRDGWPDVIDHFGGRKFVEYDSSPVNNHPPALRYKLHTIAQSGTRPGNLWSPP